MFTMLAGSARSVPKGIFLRRWASWGLDRGGVHIKALDMCRMGELSSDPRWTAGQKWSGQPVQPVSG